MKPILMLFALFCHAAAAAMTIAMPGEYAIEVEVVSFSEREALLREEGGVATPELYHLGTARTYRLAKGRVLVEFLDGRGLLLSEESELRQIKGVHFLTNKTISFLPDRVAYRIPLSIQTATDLYLQFEGKKLDQYRIHDEAFNQGVAQLANQQVIYLSEWECFLYEDLEALAMDQPVMMSRIYPDEPESKSPCLGRPSRRRMPHEPLPFQVLSEEYGSDFPAHARAVYHRLPALLNFDEERLAFSRTCIALLDEAIRWHVYSPRFDQEAIPALCAYVGEYLKILEEADWQMRMDPENQIWVPWLVKPCGVQKLDPYRVHSDLYGAPYGIPSLHTYIR